MLVAKQIKGRLKTQIQVSDDLFPYIKNTGDYGITKAAVSTQRLESGFSLNSVPTNVRFGLPRST